MAITPPGAGLFTTIHYAALALLFVATVAAILVGVRRRRVRLDAERRAAADAEAAGIAEAPAPAEPTPAITPPPQPAPAGLPPIPAPVSVPPAAPEPPQQPDPSQPPAPAPPPPAPEPSPADGPVTQLKGLGPKVAARLAELGVTSVGQLAALDADGAAALDAKLGAFTGRLQRDRWVEQARFLAAGDRKGFEAVFGKL